MAGVLKAEGSGMMSNRIRLDRRRQIRTAAYREISTALRKRPILIRWNSIPRK